MKMRIAFVFGLLAASLAQAAPVPYLATGAQTTALVASLSDMRQESGSSPPGALPLITSATVTGASSYLSASALVADGLIGTQAESDTAAGFATSIGSAVFTGQFVGASSRLVVDIALDVGDSADPEARAVSSLLVVLQREGDPFHSERLSTSGTTSRSFDLVYGASYEFQLLATSRADTTVGGNAFASALATFQVNAVPEPSTIALLLVPAAGLALARRRGASGAPA